MEIKRNKSRKKKVVFESGLGSALRRNKNSVITRIKIRKRLAEIRVVKINPKRNQNADMNKASNIQPAAVSETDSLNVNRSSKIFLSSLLINI